MIPQILTMISRVREDSEVVMKFTQIYYPWAIASIANTRDGWLRTPKYYII
jgi:hypothetical protein